MPQVLCSSVSINVYFNIQLNASTDLATQIIVFHCYLYYRLDGWYVNTFDLSNNQKIENYHFSRMEKSKTFICGYFIKENCQKDYEFPNLNEFSLFENG